MATESAASLLGELDSLVKDPRATDDLTNETDKLIPEARALAQTGRLQEAVDELLVLEKRSRQSCDAKSCSRICCEILSLYKQGGDKHWTTLREYTTVLCRKRGQLKKCVIDMVRLCTEWLTEIKADVKWALIQTLLQVTEGKIFVEVERARLTLVCAEIKEEEGDVEEAATLLQEVQVETFGAMERREKAEFVLKQMRLVLLRRDMVRCQIISRKLNLKLLEDFPDLKLSFHKYMIDYYLSEDLLLDVCKAYQAMISTKCVFEDPKMWQPILKCYVLYLLIAPFDNEQNDMLLKLQLTEKKKLAEIPIYQQLVESFLNVELMAWPLASSAELESCEVFQDKPYEGGAARWKLLRKRVVQHNVQVVGAYYSRISMQRFAALLNISPEECEDEISELVCSKYLKAKMNRPSGLVKFGDRKDTTDYLNDWSLDISKLLDLVQESSHLIQKERMINAARLKQAQVQARNMPTTTTAVQQPT
eukprot:GHVS01082403.1.p1 GENE.GHVS01082403.1~~GHVS01082403.1.p1  ORF type:complete len:478 (+),score=72.78 GHVS01082403.1:73-1506(+)